MKNFSKKLDQFRCLSNGSDAQILLAREIINGVFEKAGFSANVAAVLGTSKEEARKIYDLSGPQVLTVSERRTRKQVRDEAVTREMERAEAARHGM